MAEKCIRCGVSEERVKLFDAIYEGKINCICERCSLIEDVTILSKPNTSQVKESNRGTEVYDRMKRISGIPETGKTESSFMKKRLEELRKNPSLENPNKINIVLIDHFHWEIMKTRRRRGLSQKQLGEAINEPEFSIEIIEKGNLPENAETLVKKLEQFLRIRLIKKTEMEIMNEKQRKAPFLLDENGNILNQIPEPKIESRDFNEDENNEEENNGLFKNFFSRFKKKASSSADENLSDSQIFALRGKASDDENSTFDENSNFTEEKNEEKYEDIDLKNIDTDKIKIKDLKEWHRRKIEVSKQEKVQEQRKIEEKQRTSEARKEELRMMKEKQSKQLDNLFGGAELLKKNKENNFNEEDEKLD